MYARLKLQTDITFEGTNILSFKKVKAIFKTYKYQKRKI